MMNKLLVSLVICPILIIRCTLNTVPSIEIGDESIVVFNKTNLHFDMGFKNNSIVLNDSILRLDAGRVIIKKVKLPNYELQPTATINVHLTSNGDPWDKSGSLFIIPKKATTTLLNFEEGTFNLKQLNEDYPAIVSFQSDTSNYIPNVELLRFMTPFGVDYFNEDERTKNRKPVYIPEWEDEVHWSQDITHLLPLLEGEAYVGVYIDTWTKEGYNISASINFTESKIANHKKKKTTVLPLVNTVKYASDQRMYDGFYNTDVEVEFTLDSMYKNIKLHYITTGHGGHAEGDEFTKKENFVYIDNELVSQFIPWRNDCASFRRFNPSSGVWEEKIVWEDEETIERIASSDLSRPNWCPGSDVVPEVIDLTGLQKGEHQLKISVPEAQQGKENEYNYWMVSVYLTYDK